MLPMTHKYIVNLPISKAINKPVNVVPIFAPRMIHVAWLRVRRWLFNKLIRITDVAEELWIIAVIRIPTKTPRYLLEVKL